jgi:hypothetical protein
MVRGLLINLLALNLHAQILAPIISDHKATGGGGGGMGAWTLVNHTTQLGNGEDMTVTTSRIDCTGANLYVVAATGWGVAPAGARYTDTDGRDMTLFSGTVSSTGGGTSYAKLWWAENVTGYASVQFSAHTSYGPVFGSCWAGAATSSALDQESASGTTSCFPCSPSLTPTADGTLAVIVASAGGNSGPDLVASGYTSLDVLAGSSGVTLPSGVLYKVLGATSGVAQSPSVSSSSWGNGAVKMVNFKHN